MAKSAVTSSVNNDCNYNSDFIDFIADSGATEHIVGKGLRLYNFQKFVKRVIKSANKNQSADIKIDCKGIV